MGGFGYDPVFYDPKLGKTAAELPADLKNQLSHRGQAMAKLIAQLTELHH
jgi:XTP/dITP diphosphohydrolase